MVPDPLPGHRWYNCRTKKQKTQGGSSGGIRKRREVRPEGTENAGKFAGKERTAMIAAVDIGNTNIVIGCMDTKTRKVLLTERISTDRQKTDLEHAISFKTILELHHIEPSQIDGAIISSVVPPVTPLFKRAIQKLTNCDVLVVGPGVKTGLNIAMDNPATVGADLITGAVAAIDRYPLPVIIIDMGTATTMTVVDTHKNYIGGVIIPGLRVSLDSLSNRTSQLPHISLDAPRHVIGKNTIDCMKSGSVYGNAAMLDGMIDRMEEELGTKATVIATGGLASVVTPLCHHKIKIDDDLLMYGLLLIYEKNIRS